MSDLNEILKAALGLELHDRARLVEALLRSLEPVTTEEEIERLWADAAERRLEDFRAGRASAIPADEVAQKVRRLIR